MTLLDATVPYATSSPTKIMLSRYYMRGGYGFPVLMKKNGKGEEDEWTTEAEAMTTDEPATIDKPSREPEDDAVAAAKKEVTAEDVATPKIRLKASLATDPALQTVLSVPNVKLENASPEYLASLPTALQTALASRGFFLPETTRSESADLGRQQLFICPPCGIRYSSLSTLEAHQTYYCSHRTNKAAEDDAKSQGAEPTQSDQENAETPAKSARTGKQYTCSHCSYSADKKVSLNRHMRMHTVSPPSAQSATNGDVAVESQDRYCAECDIRFSSQKTYRAHKTHYCSSRHMVKAAAATPLPTQKTPSCTSGSTPASPVDTTSCRTPPSPGSQPQQQPFLALPTNPIIIVPYSLFCNASVLPPRLPGTNLPNPDTPCFLLPNGTLQPMTQALTCPPAAPPEVLKASNKPKEAPAKEAAPLDLSIRKSPELDSGPIDLGSKGQEKENKRKTPTPEKADVVVQKTSPPSTPVSRTGNSPSPKRKHEDSRSCSPRVKAAPKSIPDTERSQTSPETASLTTTFGIPPALHPLLLRPSSLSLLPPELQLRLSSGEIPAVPATAPQVLVKQGVSKCKECNIVFCKYENYVIHKKHYCSARLPDDDASKTSGSPPVSPSSAGATSPAAQYQQLICVACGIKFTSLDNLNAHQAYYCLKRNELEVRRCGKCRAIAEPGHQCVQSGTVAGWRCPCCEVVCATASAMQRHMETHSGVKAYRCTICRYKGNTLRGMRTHIRMHFDKRSPDLQEEKYISYILEDEAANLLEVNVATPLPGAPGVIDDRAVSPGSEGRAEPLHNCPRCLYSSVYKANVLRHVRLIHDGEEGLVNGSTEKRARSAPAPEEDEEIVVKKEAMEPEVIIAPVDEPIKEELLDVKVSEADILLEAAKPGPKYCKSCDITFQYLQSFIAHKKFYCSSHKGEITAASTNNNNRSARAAETSVL